MGKQRAALLSGTTYVPSLGQLKSFAELTIANEIDIAAPNPDDYVAKYGKYVLTLFRNDRFKALISARAAIECQKYFGLAAVTE